MESSPHVWIETLRKSHDRLAGLAELLTPGELREQSYCTGWTVAQLLSHLGSGAEIAMLMLPGALGEAEPVGREAFAPVWEVWNAKTPDEQAADALAYDDRHVTTLERLTDDQLGGMKLDFFGTQLDAVGIVRLRLGEHALHTWDVAAQHDAAATVAPDATALLIDNVPQFLGPRLGKPLGEPFRVRIVTTGPDRDYLLTSAESVTVADWPAGADADEVPVVQMPAEALLRLAYGRLDPDHTPAEVTADPDVLARLRQIFPGF
ncbi:MAG TPA: maleylpyruvate isomerase family mycothiol-dependent enzyme [Streptosporangiaceae bacterium]|nr:maleylpyruvate isomerase family mycothiol-dependent enzyme [Streptosporangiaceae bacterium]